MDIILNLTTRHLFLSAPPLRLRAPPSHPRRLRRVQVQEEAALLKAREREFCAS